MFYKFIYIIIFGITFSQPICEEGANNCAKCNYLTNLCFKCEKEIYAPDENGQKNV